MSFVMYSTTWCGYCQRLKSQLAELGVTFEEINIEEVPGTAEIVEKVNGGNRTVPTLVYSDGTAMTNPSAKQVVEKLATLKGQLLSNSEQSRFMLQLLKLNRGANPGPTALCEINCQIDQGRRSFSGGPFASPILEA
ncbi:hypothetical protein FGO68_gene12441 [Halteria grandinella]|uniref:Glutaredoxin domain-containing protein n=1 Tax=Halteria grandinella TaxID=5974 RepID=A0A8J8N9K1_HALGN|nr:hypothetical protein FGO68_gene12441 [Halteria grandinella]